MHNTNQTESGEFIVTTNGNIRYVNNETSDVDEIRNIVDVPTSQRSNFPSNHPLVVQAWSNVDGWQDTKEGAITPDTAFLRATMLLERDSAWIGNHRLVRIVPRVSERMPRI